MSTLNGGPKDIVRNGLILHLDAANHKSYMSGSTIWRDLSGNANNGTLILGPTFDSGNGGSVVFDGSNDSVTLPSATYSFSGVTMEVWSFPNTLVLGQRLIDFGPGGAAGVNTLRMYDSGNSRITCDIGGDGPESNLNAYVANVWQQNVCTANGTNILFYRNGSLGQSHTISRTPTTVSRTPRIGSNLSSSEVLNGRIAIVAVYSRALSAGEVAQNYNATKTRFGLT